MEIGIDSFAAVTNNASTTATDRMNAMAQLLERMEQADKSGLDVFGIGEHHRIEFMDSAPAMNTAGIRDFLRPPKPAPITTSPIRPLTACRHGIIMRPLRAAKWWTLPLGRLPPQACCASLAYCTIQ